MEWRGTIEDSITGEPSNIVMVGHDYPIVTESIFRRIEVGDVIPVTLAPMNANRTGIIIQNELGILYIKLGPDASPTNYTYRLTANTTFENNNYAGIYSAMKHNGTSFVNVTEI